MAIVMVPFVIHLAMHFIKCTFSVFRKIAYNLSSYISCHVCFTLYLHFKISTNAKLET